MTSNSKDVSSSGLSAMSISKAMKCMAIPAKFHPSKTFKFLKRPFGAAKKVERSFKACWCEDFQWLHYDVKSDSAFCHLCLTAEVDKKLLASMKKDPAFLTKGFTYWKHGISKTSSKCVPPRSHRGPDSFA